MDSRETANQLQAETKEENAVTLLFGTLLTVLSIIVVPGVILNGYLVRVMGKECATDRPDPLPLKFSHVRALVRDGLVTYAIWLVYALVPYSLVYLWMRNAILGESMTSTDSTLANILLSSMGLVGGLSISAGLLFIDNAFGQVLAEVPRTAAFVARPELMGILFVAGASSFLVAHYLIAASLANYAANGDVRSAFDVRHLLKGSLTMSFARAWVGAMVASSAGWVLVFVGMVMSVYNLLPGSNFLVIEFVNPDLTVASPTGAVFYTYAFVAALLYFVLLRYSYRRIGRAWTVVAVNDIVVRSSDGDGDGVDRRESSS